MCWGDYLQQIIFYSSSRPGGSTDNILHKHLQVTIKCYIYILSCQMLCLDIININIYWRVLMDCKGGGFT